MPCEDCPPPQNEEESKRLAEEAAAFETPRLRAMAAKEEPTVKGALVRLRTIVSGTEERAANSINELLRQTAQAMEARKYATSVFPDLFHEEEATMFRCLRMNDIHGHLTAIRELLDEDYADGAAD